MADWSRIVEKANTVKSRREQGRQPGNPWTDDVTAIVLALAEELKRLEEEREFLTARVDDLEDKLKAAGE